MVEQRDGAGDAGEHEGGGRAGLLDQRAAHRGARRGPTASAVASQANASVTVPGRGDALDHRVDVA